MLASFSHSCMLVRLLVCSRIRSFLHRYLISKFHAKLRPESSNLSDPSKTEKLAAGVFWTSHRKLNESATRPPGDSRRTDGSCSRLSCSCSRSGESSAVISCSERASIDRASNSLCLSQCSASCGNGTRERSVSCPVAHRCEPFVRPGSLMACYGGSCEQWVVGEWSDCQGCGQNATQRR